MKDRTSLLCLLVLVGSLVLAPLGSPYLAAQTAQRAAVPAEARTAPLDQPVPVEDAVRTGQFANGLRYFIRENHEPENRVELRLVVKAGSILEDSDQRGLAHFLEHMAFNGTRNFEKGKLIEFMESIGMRIGPGINASTSFDETIFTLQLPADSPQNIATAFQIMEDWAHNLTLDSEEINKERGVVIEEWRLGQGAASRLRDKQFPVLLKGSRYAERLPIGTKESLDTFNHDALRRFYRDWYRPDLIGIVAVGDFDVSEIETLVRNHFATLPMPADPRPRPVYPVPDHAETLFTIATDREMPSTSVSVYHKMPHVEDWTVGGYRDRIVENLYNSMLSGRFAEIARQPNPPFLGAGSSKGQLIGPKDAYILSAGVPEDGIERGVDVLFTEAARVARFGFTATELEREKTDTLRGIERAYITRDNRSSGSFASEYVRAFLDGESIPGIAYEFELYKRFVGEITLDEVNQIGRDWIKDTNRVVTISGPEKTGVTMPGEQALAAVIAAATRKEITPFVDSVTDQPLLAQVPDGSMIIATRTLDAGITEWDLANGVKVVLKPTDFQEDQIAFRAFSPGGTSLARDEDYIPAATAISVIANGGIGPFNAVDLQKLLTGKVANASPFVSTFEEGVSGSASPRDLETMFQLIYLRFTAPRADQAFFDVFKTQGQRALANRDANPRTAFGDVYNRIMTQDNPRERPFTLESLNKIDLAKSLAFYKDRFADASDYKFIFVGNIDLDAMRPLVERYLGGLPSTRREETWRDTGVRPPTGVISEVVRRGIEPQSQTIITFTGPFEFRNQAQRTTIQAMAQTLQSRLRNVLREDLGGTYSVGVGADMSWRPQETYTVTINFGSAPERAEELRTAIANEIEKAKATGPTDQEVADAREAMLRSFETSLRQNNFWLSQLVADYQRGAEPAASVATYPDSVRALTPASIQEATRRYLNTENQVRVTLLPEAN